MDLWTQRARPMPLRSNQFEVRLANGEDQINAALRLRFEVFNRELGVGIPRSERTGADRDQFDDICDHFIVIDHDHQEKVVATYRLLRGQVAVANKGFICGIEFKLPALFQDRAQEVLELGRFCVHPDYRRSPAVRLLWNGLAVFVEQKQALYLIGSASVLGTDPQLASRLFAHFKDQGQLAQSSFWAIPAARHLRADFDPDLPPEHADNVSSVVPITLRSTLRFGARVASHPSFDPAFGSTDFFTVLDVTDVASGWQRRLNIVGNGKYQL